MVILEVTSNDNWIFRCVEIFVSELRFIGNLILLDIIFNFASTCSVLSLFDPFTSGDLGNSGTPRRGGSSFWGGSSGGGGGGGGGGGSNGG